MNSQNSNNLLRDPRTSWGHILIVLIFAALVGVVISAYLYKWFGEDDIMTLPPTQSIRCGGFDNIQCPKGLVCVKSDPLPGAKGICARENKVAGWNTFLSATAMFEFQYPKYWKVQGTSSDEIKIKDISGKTIISFSDVNRTIAGISYCEAYPQDSPRCEAFIVKDISVIIDWEADHTANALFLVREGTGLSVTLYDLDNETKNTFRTFLSTFKFSQ